MSKNFDVDPFAQAAAEVENKSWDEQILHSRLLDKPASIISGLTGNKTNTGSAVSKGISAGVSIGKLFLSLIPVPIVGSVSGALIDLISDKAREHHLEKNVKSAKTFEDQVKFKIKQLTVEDLDRYRRKLSESFEALNNGLKKFNQKTVDEQNCDSIYALALLIQQTERRKAKLRDELNTFTEVIKLMNEWIADLEKKNFSKLHELKEEIKKETLETLRKAQPSASNADVAKAILAAHAGCEKWCCAKETAKYDPNAWPKLKSRFGKGMLLFAPVAYSAITVKAGDYRKDSSNSKMT